MMEAHQKQKAKEAIYPIFQQYQFSSQPKQFIRGLMIYLDLDQPKVYQKNIVADKIASIYDNFRGEYEQFLNQPKFKSQNIPSDVNSFFWTVFKKYDQQRRNTMQYQPRHMYSRDPIPPPYMNLPNQNMNMSMVNMFLDVPNLQSLEQIQTFQKKMFQVYKNAIPHVMNSMVYRPNPYHQSYGLNTFSNLTPGVSGSNLGGLNAMGGLGSMPGMQGVGNISGMQNMGYQMKAPQYYDSNNNYGNRYMTNFQHQSKTIPNQYRGNQSGIPNLGFNLFDRGNEDIRSYKTLGAYPEQRFYEEQQRKQPGHKIFGLDQQMPSAFNIPFSSSLLEKDRIKNTEREPVSLSSLQLLSEPRKQVKRGFEEENIILREEGNKENRQTSCICQDKQAQQICYKCRICSMDPFNEVEQSLRIDHIDEQKSQVEIVINKKTLQRILVNPEKLDIELRCIKIDRDGENEICWPERYKLSIDNDIIEDFTSNQNTSNKKRKDKPVVFSKLFGDEKYSQQNVVILIQRKKSQKTEPSNYLFGAFIVNKLTVDKLYEKMMKKMQQRNISQFFKNEKDESPQLGTKEPLSISPFYNSTLIKDPVRGKLCTHPECFDLKSFLASVMVSPNRLWRCPICSKQAKQVTVDQVVKSILLNIEKMIKQPKQIAFYPNGSHILRYQQESQIRKENVIISKKPSEEPEEEQNRPEK